MKKGALAGFTVLVTRPRSQATELVNGLRRSGGRVISAPAIRIANPSSWAGLEHALKRLESYDALIFTSANGVAQFFERAVKVLGRRPSRPRRLYAIGPQTAKALRRRGWHGIGVPDIHEGEALARKLGTVKGWKILIPRAKKARDVLPKLLRRRGATVDVVEAYRTIGDASGLGRIRRVVLQDSADVVTFTSSSTVEHFMMAISRAQARRFFGKTIAASIGPITSHTLRRYGVRRIVEAKAYTSTGLIRAIVKTLSNGKR